MSESSESRTSIATPQPWISLPSCNSPGSLTRVRALCSELAGGQDFATNHWLYRFKLPSLSNGSTRIYTLGAKGRNYLANEMGLPADWYFRAHKLKYVSHSQADHNLSLTRFLIAAQAWANKHPNYRIAHMRISYELAKTTPPIEITTQGKTEKLKVIPDGWVLIETLNNGAHERFIPVWVELDRGTEAQQRFREHIRSRITYIQSGAYRERFQTNAVVIAYLTTGQTPEYRETRRKAMCRWTMEVLADLHLENWSHIFHFASVECDRLYSTPLFDAPIWYRPDSSSPVRLFSD